MKKIKYLDNETIAFYTKKINVQDDDVLSSEKGFLIYNGDESKIVKSMRFSAKRRKWILFYGEEVFAWKPRKKKRRKER